MRQIRKKESPKADQEGRYRTRDMIPAVLAFLLAAAAGAAFIAIYWSGGGTAALGTSLAAALAGLGVGLVLWAHRLMPHREVSSERESVTSDAAEREAFFHDFVADERLITRRRTFAWLIGTVVGVLGLGGISLLRSFIKSPMPDLTRTDWEKGKRLVTFDGKPIAVDTLLVDGILPVFPEGHTDSLASQALLIRVQENDLKLPEDRSGWTPKGYVAYSRICTHAGCPVGLFESERHLLLCPCHQSTFDVLRGAVPTSGPAARPLPQLPLYVDNAGHLRAGGGFTGPPGPGFWRQT